VESTSAKRRPARPNSEHRTCPHGRHLLGEPRDRVERVSETGLEGPAMVGELQRVGATPEQRESKTLFQQPHPLAYRGLGDVQLRRRRSEAPVTSRRLECAQPIQKGVGDQSLIALQNFLGLSLSGYRWRCKPKSNQNA